MNYLINETTKEEREELVYKALGISKSDACDPSDYAMSLAKKYIAGELELEEIQQMIIEKYRGEE
jgi:hypothetical protein